MSTIVTRAGKGSPLTHTEVDNNFTNLNTDKYQSGDNASFGTLAATGDVSIADKIVHTGDTNTAIRFPAADTVTVETNGAERLRIDSSGNVGIGTSSPSNRLEVSGSIVSTDGTTNNRMTRSGGVGLFGTTTNHPIAFQTNDTERMRITSNGNVGIGTTNPAGYKLFVSGTGYFNGALQTAGNLYTTGTMISSNSGSNPLTFGINDGERMRIDTSGRLIVASLGYQPRFLAERSGTQTGYNATSTGDVVVIYNSVVQNIGSHYNGTTGKFTAPVAGMYAFQASAFSNGGTAFAQIWLVVNGSRASYTDCVYGTAATAKDIISGTWVIYLTANDSVGVHPYNTSDSNQSITADNWHTWFKGYLIG